MAAGGERLSCQRRRMHVRRVLHMTVFDTGRTRASIQLVLYHLLHKACSAKMCARDSIYLTSHRFTLRTTISEESVLRLCEGVPERQGLGGTLVDVRCGHQT